MCEQNKASRFSIMSRNERKIYEHKFDTLLEALRVLFDHRLTMHEFMVVEWDEQNQKWTGVSRKSYDLLMHEIHFLCQPKNI